MREVTALGERVMSNYVRVFCAATFVPSIKQVLDWTANDGYRLSIDPPFRDVDVNTSDWRQLGLLYAVDKPSLLLELDLDNKSDDSLVHQEIQYFEKLLADVADSEARREVVEHISQAKYIVSFQIPSNFDEAGADALSSLLTYFIQKCNGIVQADGKGFYEGDELIVEIG